VARRPLIAYSCPRELINYRYFGYYLLTTNGRRPIKGSEDADFRLILFKRKKQKLPLALGAQGSLTSSKKN